MTARIVVTDPFAQTTQHHDVNAGVPLSTALMEISPTRWGGSTFALYEGAIGPAGEIAAENAAGIVLRDGEVYQVVVLPAEPISTGALIAAAIGVTSTVGVALVTVAVYIAIMAITMAISFLATMLLSPGKQSNKALAPADQASGLNSLSPPRNLFRLGSRITDIYGTMRFWPDLIFNATVRWEGVAWEADIDTPTENPRSTSQQHVTAVYSLGRGHYQMTDWRFGDSPIQSANGAVYIYPPGVTLPERITATFSIANLSRQEVGGPNSATEWTPWYEIPSPEISRVDVQVAFPSGLINLVSGKKVPGGFVQAMVAEITIQMERLDADDNVVEAVEFVRPVRAKTRNELRVTFTETVTTGRWRVRMAETNDQAPFPNGNSETMVKKTALEGIVGHRLLSVAERTFEHETVLIVDANNVGGPALQNMEAFNLLATRVLPTQDVPGVLTEWRPDGRWITAAINTLIDPFICNYSMDEVDWPSLFAVQASLDAYPEPYPESGFNAALDRQMTADEQLMLVARKARAQVFPSGGKITFARDERRAGVSALFNRRNRLLGRTDVGMGLQFAGRDDPDGVEITWTNADDDYRQETYAFPEGFTAASPLTMDLVGAVHKWEVCRRARFEMAQIQYRRRTMPLRVTEEGQLLLPYDRVAVVMPWDEGVSDGEVLEVDGLGLRLSRMVPPALTSEARIRLRAPDGRQTALIGVAADTISGPDWVTLDEAPLFSILGPTDDTQLGTLYSLSTTDAADAATHWLMTGAEIDEQGVAITLMEDADEVFQLSDDLFNPCEDEPVPPVEAFTFTQYLSALDAVMGESTVADGGFFFRDITQAITGITSDVEATFDGTLYTQEGYLYDPDWQHYLAARVQTQTSPTGSVVVGMGGVWTPVIDPMTSAPPVDGFTNFKVDMYVGAICNPDGAQNGIWTRYVAIFPIGDPPPDPRDSVGGTYTFPAGTVLLRDGLQWVLSNTGTFLVTWTAQNANAAGTALDSVFVLGTVTAENPNGANMLISVPRGDLPFIPGYVIGVMEFRSWGPASLPRNGYFTTNATFTVEYPIT